MTIRIFLLSLVCMALPLSSALAAGGGGDARSQDWHFQGAFGTYDKAALQRGLQVYRNVCSACHSMDLVYYRNLSALGYDEAQIKNIAAEYTVEDGPNDEGDMFERSARPSDSFKAPFANENAARYANNGAYPPDFSLIIKARKNGPDYVYNILTGYEHAPEGADLLDGQYWNTQAPGNVSAMAPPLSDGMVGYEDGSAETLDQYARDLVEFLAWAGDPYMEKRKYTGFKVMFFLIIFAGIMYRVKRKVWSTVH